MLTKLLDALGTATDVRTIAAIVLATLATILPAHLSVVVKSVVDGFAGIVVVVDTFQIHKSKQAAAARAATPATSSSTTSTGTTA